MLTDRVEARNTPDIFNLLRGIAILCVFGFHIKGFGFGNYPVPWWIILPGQAVMWVFFIISGYLLGKGFYSNKYKVDKKGVMNFWLSRFIRIAPMYFFFILLFFVFCYDKFLTPIPVRSIIQMFTFTCNNFINFPGSLWHLWFVSTIIQLYFLAPLGYKYIISKVKNRHLLYLFLLILLGLGIRLLENLFKLNWSNYTFSFSLSQLDLFFGGMLLNAITQNSEDNQLKRMMRPVSVILLLILIIVTAYQLHIKISWAYKYIYPTIYLLVTLLIIYVHDYKGKNRPLPLNFKNIIRNPLRLIEAVGIISFSFYIYHLPIMPIFPALLPKSNPQLYVYGSLFGAFILTVILSTCIYFMLEKPMNKFRKTIAVGGKND